MGGAIRELNIDGVKLPIKEFLLQYVLKGASILIIAKKGSGKSWVCRCLIEYFNVIRIPGGMIISKTEEVDPFFTKFFPDMYVHYKYSTHIIDKLLERQDEMCIKFKERAKKGKLADPRLFLLMDDCLADAGNWKNDDGIKEILMNGRHYELSYILTMQDPMGIPPQLRTNFDYIFLLADDFITNQEKIYRHYAGMIDNQKLFREMYVELTKDYGAMVLVNRGQRKTILDKVFWYKAHGVSIKKYGCVQFREMSYRNYDPDWKKKHKISVDDMMKGLGKKRK